MTTTQHTPGPWAVTFGKYNASIHTDVTISRISDEAHAWKANANLLSSAPDLLSALQWFADELPGIIRQYCPEGVPTKVGEAHEAALSAIAKAKGEA